MIDPNKITNFNRTQYELEEFALFCITVAGKNSHVQAKKLDSFLYKTVHSYLYSPFENVLYMEKQDIMGFWLRYVSMGQYTRIAKAFAAIARLDVKTCTLEELMEVPGVGPKTARFFLVHSRPNQRFATLDTHILKWMNNQGIKAPKSTPSGKKYLELEKVFLSLVPAGMSVAEFDLQIWNTYNVQGKISSSQGSELSEMASQVW